MSKKKLQLFKDGNLSSDVVPGKGLEPSHLSVLVPKTSASTISPPGRKVNYTMPEGEIASVIWSFLLHREVKTRTHFQFSA